jgi:hypothetical protein
MIEERRLVVVSQTYPKADLGQLLGRDGSALCELVNLLQRKFGGSSEQAACHSTGWLQVLICSYLDQDNRLPRRGAMRKKG